MYFINLPNKTKLIQFLLFSVFVCGYHVIQIHAFQPLTPESSAVVFAERETLRYCSVNCLLGAIMVETLFTFYHFQVVLILDFLA